ncbi:MAG: DUF4435 domain-containing protein [Bacteroidales bacterium]|nr:DUF4435 domain-containing protein [Candidatus Equimonas enterica]
MGLRDKLNSDFIAAAGRLRGRGAPERVVAYVESFDDILFWSGILREAEDKQTEYEVMLPSRTTLAKGKKIALQHQLGPNMIACVDADYDYLMQGATPMSRLLCTSPYVLHTRAYAIENFQCYAPALHQVCVSATLNDRRALDFEAFLMAYSRIIYPLFVWSIWAYRNGQHSHFSMLHFADTTRLIDFSLAHPERCLETLRQRCNRRIGRLQREFPNAKKSYLALRDELGQLGVSPDNAYMYIRGHDLHDGVIARVLDVVCDALRREREREIMHLAVHEKQKQNELSAYKHAAMSYDAVLRKHDGYRRSALYGRVVEEARALTQRLAAERRPKA